MSVIDDVKEFIQKKVSMLPEGIFKGFSFEEGVEKSLSTVFESK